MKSMISTKKVGEAICKALTESDFEISHIKTDQLLAAADAAIDAMDLPAPLELGTLRLEPGQVLVVKLDLFSIDKEAKEKVKAYFETAVPALKGRLLILTKMMAELSILEVA